MNIVNKAVRKFHKITGITAAVFFLMWFASGLVLLYHKYPKVTEKEMYSRMDVLRESKLPEIGMIPGMTDTTKIKTLSVARHLGHTAWTISTKSSRKDNAMSAKSDTGKKLIFAGDSLLPLSSPTRPQLDSIARIWAGSENITSADTLNERGQWILYEKYEKQLPIIRYKFDNPKKSEIFISIKNGEVVQESTRPERIWSYVGAIPHKLYIPSIRTDMKLWENTLLAGALLCLAASLSGIYIGIYYLLKNKRKHRHFATPFKRKVWRYHHISGLIFGIFLIGWGISGCLSMQRIPKWMVGYEGDYLVSSSRLWGKKNLQLEKYKLNYKDLFKCYNDIKSISWEHFGNIPAYHIVAGEEEHYIDASHSGEVKALDIPQEEIGKAVRRCFGDSVGFTMTLMNEYDEYYLAYKGNQPLPVWKVEIDNNDGSRLYVSPADGYVKYLNRNRMAKKWLFAAPHYLDAKWFMLHQDVRYASLWILCLGGIFVILTGACIFATKEKSKHKKQ